MSVVYTGGTFDLIHPGHIHLLRQCRDLAKGGKVVVSVNTDEFVLRYKGRRPVMNFEDRCAVLAAIRYVDTVIPNWGCEDSKLAIEFSEPDIIAIGQDWAPPRDYNAQMGFTEQWLEERGIQVVYLPLLDGRSSTNLRKSAIKVIAEAQ